MQQLLTAPELAQVLNVKPSSIYRYSAEGKIPTLRVGALIRFRLPDVIRVMGGSNNGDHSMAAEKREEDLPGADRRWTL